MLASISGPIVLVGHSYGGAVITNAATANPNVKALVYLARSLAESLAVRQAGAELGLTEALTRHLLSDYAILPDTLCAPRC